MEILCIIPARSGSKGIKDKNIKLFNGKPLISWSIEQALQSKHNMKIIVSTDSEKYAEIARKYGAEVPFIRPALISQDTSTDIDFIKHTINWFSKHRNYHPDIILQLRPTQPCRKVSTIDNCIDIFIEKYNEYDSLRTVVEFSKSPFKMYTIKENILCPLFESIDNIEEPYNQCRQFLPKTYLHNGYVDLLKPSILNKNTISGSNIYPYVMDKEDTVDIDTQEDWNKSENIKCNNVQ